MYLSPTTWNGCSSSSRTQTGTPITGAWLSSCISPRVLLSSQDGIAQLGPQGHRLASRSALPAMHQAAPEPQGAAPKIDGESRRALFGVVVGLHPRRCE